MKNNPKSPAGNSAVATAEDILIVPAPPAVEKGKAPKLLPVVVPTSNVEPASTMSDPASVLLLGTVIVWKYVVPSPINTGLEAVGIVADAGPPCPVFDHVAELSQLPFERL